MKDGVWKRSDELVDRALDLPERSRDAFLVAESGGNAELLAESRALLNSISECPEGFFTENSKSYTSGESTAPFLLSLAPGLQIEKYELLRRLGRGAGGMVYAARDSELKRLVALKIASKTNLSVSLRERFRREAKIAAELDHQGIVRVYSYGENDDFQWIAMELVNGHDLGRELQVQVLPSDEPNGQPYLPIVGDSNHPRAVAKLGVEIARALDVAHRAGVVHRDIKPANILLLADGSPKIADFGLARRDRDPALTEDGVRIGTAYYSSREQCRGENIDSLSDVYSLGAVLFHALTHEPPFRGKDSDEVVLKIQSEPIPTIRTRDDKLPHDLEAVIAMAMAEDPSKRYVSAELLARDLENYLEHRPVHARPTSFVYHALKWFERNRLKVILSLVSGIAIVWSLFMANSMGESSGLHRQRLLEVEGMETDSSAAIENSNDSELAMLVPRIRSLRESVEASDDLAIRLDDLRAKIDQRGQQAQLEIEARVGSSLAPGFEPTDDRALLQAAAEMTLVNRLRLEPDTESALVGWFPTVSLHSPIEGAKVFFFPVNSSSGEYDKTPVFEAKAPLDEVPVPPGRYRILVDAEGAGYAELTRWLGEWRRHFDLGQVTLRPTLEVAGGMVMLSAGTQELMFPILENGEQARRTYAHGEFLMDQHEVSNRDYAQFLEAHQDQMLRPITWPSNDREEAWLDLPVAGVSWIQARAYAEWRGKRLPTELEWMRAAVGSDRRAFPWGDEKENIIRSIVGREHTSSKWSSERLHDLYLEHARPVWDGGIDRSPEGILHLAGNVTEWVDTTAFGEIEGRLYPLASRGRTKGWNWSEEPGDSLEPYTERQTVQPFARPLIGFRCAKSILP